MIWGKDRFMNDVAYKAFCLLKDKGLKISAAESCTGGLFTKLLTDIPGSSAVLDLSMVTYANEAKVKFLGVRDDSIKAHGVVSEEVACEMARGIKGAFGADIGIGITGIAGPDGGTAQKPVGLVWTAIAVGEKVYPAKLLLDGDREQIRIKTCEVVYGNLCNLIEEQNF